MATISQVNINDLSYDFIDVKSRNILTEFYDGERIFLDAEEYSAIYNPAINIYNPALGNSQSAASSGNGEKLIGVADKTGEIRSLIGYFSWASGEQGIEYTTRRQIDSVHFSSPMFIENGLELSFDMNCNPSVWVEAAQPWRRALGFGDDINTTTISEIITPNSGITIVDAHYIERFNIAMLYLHFKYNQAISVTNQGNITDINIGTLVAGKRPFMHAEACSNGDEGGAAWYDINPSTGAIAFCAIEGMSTTRTIAANTQFNLASTYIVR